MLGQNVQSRASPHQTENYPKQIPLLLYINITCTFVNEPKPALTLTVKIIKNYFNVNFFSRYCFVLNKI
jgi:hypothetical protein